MSHAYDGSTWREIAEWWAYDAATWREICEAWSYDGSVWRLVHECESCDTATCTTILQTWHDQGNLGCSACSAGNCGLCVRLNHNLCTDPCHNVDIYVSKDSGSFLLQIGCANDSCTNDTGCGCSASATYEYSCEVYRRCTSQSSTYKSQAKIQRDGDSGIDCTITYGGSHTGICIA